MNKEERVQLMLHGDLKKTLLKMGIPTVFGMLINALYIVVDGYFVTGLGTSAFAAVSVVFPLVQIVIGIGLVFGTGGSSYIARLLGAGEKERANRTASTTLFGGLIGSIFFIVLFLLFIKPLLFTLGATEQSYGFAHKYATIILSGSIFNILSIIMGNLTIAEGRVKLTMIGMTTGAVLNIILDPIFIYTLSMGVSGAAIATVLAEFIANIFYFQFILRKKSYLHYSLKNFRPDKIMLQEIFKIGLPSFFVQLLTSFSMGYTNQQARMLGGDDMVAAMGVMLRLMALGSFVVFGYTKGYQPVVGANYGAKQYHRVRLAIRTTLLWLTSFCAIFGISIALFSHPIAMAFSNDSLEVSKLASKALLLNGLIFIGFGFQCTYSQAFLALGRGKESFILNISRQGIFFFPAMYFLSKYFGIKGIFWAQPIADICTIIQTLFLVLRANKTLHF